MARCNYDYPDGKRCRSKGKVDKPWWEAGFCKAHWLLVKGEEAQNTKPNRKFQWHTHCNNCGRELIRPMCGIHGYCGRNCRAHIYNQRMRRNRLLRRIIAASEVWIKSWA